MQVALTDRAESPFDNVAHHEVQQRVEEELQEASRALSHHTDPARSGRHVIRRDRGCARHFAGHGEVSAHTRRDALRKRLAEDVREVGPELGLLAPDIVSEREQTAYGLSGNAQSGSRTRASREDSTLREGSRGGRPAEVTP